MIIPKSKSTIEKQLKDSTKLISQFSQRIKNLFELTEDGEVKKIKVNIGEVQRVFDNLPQKYFIDSGEYSNEFASFIDASIKKLPIPKELKEGLKITKDKSQENEIYNEYQKKVYSQPSRLLTDEENVFVNTLIRDAWETLFNDKLVLKKEVFDFLKLHYDHEKKEGSFEEFYNKLSLDQQMEFHGSLVLSLVHARVIQLQKDAENKAMNDLKNKNDVFPLENLHAITVVKNIAEKKELASKINNYKYHKPLVIKNDTKNKALFKQLDALVRSVNDYLLCISIDKEDKDIQKLKIGIYDIAKKINTADVKDINKTADLLKINTENLLLLEKSKNPKNQKAINSLNGVKDELLKFKKMRESIIEPSIDFFDPLGLISKKSIKNFSEKGEGANRGFNAETEDGLKFTIKQGKRIGNTISEAYTASVLKEMVEEKENSKNERIADAHLVLKKPNEKEGEYKTAEDVIKNVYVASHWSNVHYSIEASDLFGLKDRPRMAGTRFPNFFKGLRRLNEKHKLGLDLIMLPSAVVVDYDAHMKNFMLNFDISDLNGKNQDSAKRNIEELKKYLHKIIRTNDMSDAELEKHLNALDGRLGLLEMLNVKMYFHKIDHDSGFYHYTDPSRSVDFSSHRTSPIAISMPGSGSDSFIETQPTFHIGEVIGGLENAISMFSTDESKEILKSKEKQIGIVNSCADKLFKNIDQICDSSGLPTEEKMRLSFQLLNGFNYQLVNYNSKPKGDKIDNSDIVELRESIKSNLTKGTNLKMDELRSQMKSLLEEKKDEKTSESPPPSPLMEEKEIQSSVDLVEIWKTIHKKYQDKRKGFFSKGSNQSSELIIQIEKEIKDGGEDLNQKIATKMSNYLNNPETAKKRLTNIIQTELSEKKIDLDKIKVGVETVKKNLTTS